ncbi:MAG: lyase family protein [Candidatus Parcubacteria bacterium]|nr:lyase family protein [Candidatus Parcubacteria bacterium]
MIERYSNKDVKAIWSNEMKLKLWETVEKSVIAARCDLGIFPSNIIIEIRKHLDKVPIDIDWWKERDKEINPDLNAFIDERVRHLPSELHQYFHKGMTSYDTEEPALSVMILHSIDLVNQKAREILNLLPEMAKRFKNTPMLARTHGQEAKLQSFGKRCFTWSKGLRMAFDELQRAKEYIYFSKLSGAIGNYQGLTPDEEEKALAYLGLQPYKGATQIMPRLLHQPLANALVMVVGALTQIAEDVRLSARSGLPILQEPFGKKQKGSSAMPHKKNTITCENQIGMYTMATKFVAMLRERMITWEERAIEQSCVERVAWPDLFHVVLQSFKNMKKIVEGLQVFPDNMMIEIINSRGCYASEDAKDWLKEHGAELGLSHEDAYRIVQLAAFNVHEVSLYRQNLRANPSDSFEKAEKTLNTMYEQLRHASDNAHTGIDDVIMDGKLTYTAELDITPEEIERWNTILNELFDDFKNIESFKEIFSIKYQLRNEHFLFEELK